MRSREEFIAGARERGGSADCNGRTAGAIAYVACRSKS
jgi:hypothetical protein